jgi:hypothetical protein
MTQRNWSFLGLVCLVLLVAPPARALAEGVSLSWHFKPGATLHYVAKQEVVQNISSAAVSGKMNVGITLDLTWAVQSVDAQQVASLTQTIDRVQMIADGPQGMKTQYDSASGKEPEGAAKSPDAKALWLLVKKPMTLKINPQGKILEFKLPQDVLDQIQKTPAVQSLGKTFSEEGMKQVVGLSALPQESLVPGKSWNDESLYENPQAGKQKVKSTYTYVGPKTVEGKPAQQIDSLVTLEVLPPEQQVAKIEIKEQHGTGTIYFDAAAGRLLQSTTTMKLKMSVEFGGQSLTSDATTSRTFQLVPRGK